MEKIFRYIEENNDSLDELLEQVSGPTPIKDRMKDKYKDRIIFSRINNKKTVVCYRATGEKILNEMWYSSRSKEPQAERQRIATTAGKIILEDNESMAYDNSVFPPTDKFCSSAKEMVPDTLRFLWTA